MNVIFEYMNYREFLRDWFDAKKKTCPFYSFRLFSQKAGFTSPNFLKLVQDNKRNLTKESIFKFVKAMALIRKEADYFENLVFFNQAHSIEEKNLYLSNLIKLRARADVQKIDQSAYAYFSAWYHPVIRELCCTLDWRGDYKKLAAAVIPAITPVDAQKSISLLLELGFIKRLDADRFEKTASTISTGAQVKSLAVANFHRAMLQRATESLERFSSAERDISGLTLHVSKKTYQSMIIKIQQFRGELLQMAEADTESSMVAQINMQAFPLSKVNDVVSGVRHD